MSGPMSDEQLAEIQRRWALAKPGEGFRLTIYDAASPGALNVALHEADNDVTALLAEVHRQRALWSDVADMARRRKAEADGRRVHAERLKADLAAARAEAAEERARADHAETASDKRLREAAALADTLRDTQTELRLAQNVIDRLRRELGGEVR
ncbi:hypothetical protein ACFVH6_22290 [Spirillospora sp. NPDC127200]